MLDQDDMTLNCRQCGKTFVFTTGEQEFYKLKELTFPSRCPECRSTRRNQLNNHQVCSQCGTEFEKGASVYCTSCLASVHLECELSGKQSEKLVAETESKLQTLETEHAKLTESLQVKDQLVIDLKQTVSSLKDSLKETEDAQDQLKELEIQKAELTKSVQQKASRLTELEETVNNLNQELEKVRQFNVDMQWIQPAINTVNARLESLERNQNTTNQRMLQIVEKMHDLYESMDLWTLFKRGLSIIFFGQRTEREEQVATWKNR